MNIFCSYWWRLREKLFKQFNMFRVIETKEGLKPVNVILVRLNIIPEDDKILYINPKDLYLGIDNLKDQYTLLGCNLLDSPHYYFIKSLLEEQPISETDYIKRYISGTLDGRIGVLKNIKFGKYYEKMSLRLEQFKSNTIAPVYVHIVNGKYYLYDGKHRAALCAYMNVPVPCQIVNFQFETNAMFKIMKTKKDYNKHIALTNK